MRILLTGATGYIGKRILPILINEGHHVICCVRDKSRFTPPESLRSSITVIELDLLKASSLSITPTDIDVAYYLVHSMSVSANYKTWNKNPLSILGMLLKLQMLSRLFI